MQGTLVDNTACSRDRKTESCLRSGLGLVCGKSSSVRAVKGSSERVTQAGRKSYRQAYNRTLIEVMDDVALVGAADVYGRVAEFVRIPPPSPHRSRVGAIACDEPKVDLVRSVRRRARARRDRSC